MADYHEAEDYLRLWREVGTPSEIRRKVAVFNAIVREQSLPAYKERQAAIDDLIEERERRAWLWDMIKRAAMYAAIVSGGWIGFLGIMAYLRDWILGLK